MSVSCFCWVGPPPALPLLPSLRIWYAPSLGALGVALCSLDTARPGCRHCFSFCCLGCRQGPSAQASLPLAQQGPGLPNSRQGHTAPLTERGHQCHRNVALALSQALWIPAMRAWTALAAHSGSSGSCTTSTAAPRPPIMLLILCGNRARIPGPCAYSYKSAGCCLAAGRGVSREPREMGVCSRPRGRGPRPEWEQPPRPAGADCSAQTAASAGALAGVQDTEEEALVTF